jgi:hypothetical protein
MSRNASPGTEQNKPAKLLRRGGVAVSIWRREHEGEVFYNVTPSRAFKRKGADEGDPFEYSDNFSTDDLPTLSRLLDMAFAWIVSQAAK